VTARHVAALAEIAALVVLVGVVLPLRTERRLARLRERIANDPRARLRFYARYLAVAAASLALCAVVVGTGGEGFDRAGAGWPPYATRMVVAGLVLAELAVIAVLLVVKVVATRYDPAALDREKQLGRIAFLIPETPAERRAWPLVATAIGLQEEALFRGVFVLYVATLTGVSPWLLAVTAALVFAVGHRYQAWVGAVGTGGLGLGFGLVTAMTGSIWPAVVLHALFDLRLMFLKPIASRQK
jgi:membrane protease YdiL (CAAX protease family)